MCGIAGIILKSNSEAIDLYQRLNQMNQAMLHRGPDDEGCFVSSDGRVGLANRRLAIRDLSPAGHMPMCDNEQMVWITYNGEVYNADILRDELEALGYSFHSSTDTEVILKGYKQWGRDLLPRLRGMFAFAIYDEHSGEVMLARDHLGIKPLYYAETASAIVFASEIKALLASDMVSREISSTGLMGYLLTGSVPNPLTTYRDIRALEPASSIHLDQSSIAIQPAAFWQLPTTTGGNGDAKEQVRDLLMESVRMRLVSDVPLGAFLSGGLDSSSVVALMRQATSGDIRTCSMVFEEADYSEAPYAQAVADQVGADHYQRVITAADVAAEFDNILAALDQPSNDGVNTYFVSQTARQAGLTVALSGLGGDELFGGYPNTFNDVPRIHNALKFANAVPAGMALAKIALRGRSKQQSWRLIADALNRPPSLSSAYWTRRGFFTHDEASELLHPDLRQANGHGFDPVGYLDDRTVSDSDTFAWISRAELRTYTHNQLLRDTDVMSMAHSLEVRVPLLDHRLVEAVLRLPARAKSGSNGRIKPLLLDAMKDDLPLSVANRQDKRGFTFPLDVWLRGPLQSRMLEIIDQVKQQLWINPDAVDEVMRQYMGNRIHWSRAWSLVALGSVVA